jgi:mannose/fructose/N-acetylgalactosamine-specific phosphotransferase system component IIC
MELADFFIIALLGALLTLDTTTVLQAFISQPIIACTLIGWAGGDVYIGLQIGMVMQFLWITNIPVGAAIIPGGNGAAMIATALAIHLNVLFPGQFNIILLLIVLYAILLSYIGAELRLWHRNKNVFLLDYIMNNIDHGGFNVLRRAIYLSVLLNYFRFFIIIFIGLVIGDLLLSNLLKIIPALWNTYAKYTVTALWAIGLGLGLTLYDTRDMRKYIIIGIGFGIVIMRVIA